MSYLYIEIAEQIKKDILNKKYSVSIPGVHKLGEIFSVNFKRFLRVGNDPLYSYTPSQIDNLTDDEWGILFQNFEPVSFDPSTAGEISQPVVGPIGSMVETDSSEESTTSYTRTRRSYRSVEAATDSTLNRTLSSSDVAKEKQDKARAKLLRLRMLTR